MHLKNIIFFILFLCSSYQLEAFTLLLQPAGDARHPGRSIHGSYERGLSIQLAEELKELLERKDITLNVIVPRFNGQSVEPLQHAAIANRLNVDAYIAIMLYEQQESNAQLGLYTYAADPSDALKTIRTNSLAFIPFDQAHLTNHQTSYRMADVLLTSFQAKPLFTIIGNQVHAIPLKNLTGILAPSVAIELSIQNTKKIKEYAQSLADALHTMLQSLKQWSLPA
ncbi:MAG: N-acetylmuramoyl-L-alanine amidase [Candidatus Babeliales bacterium]